MNKTISLIINFWGRKLHKLSEESIKRYRLTSDVSYFLTSVGLPIDDDLIIHFYNNRDLLKEIECVDKRYLCIGDDFGTQVCIQQDTGRIFSIDSYHEYPTRFINSNIKNLLLFLCIFSDKKEALANCSNEEAVHMINEIRYEYNKIDPIALDNEENWWSIILEQTEQGLM